MEEHETWPMASSEKKKKVLAEHERHAQAQEFAVGNAGPSAAEMGEHWKKWRRVP